MAKILEYPNQTARIPKGAIILCPHCKRENYRTKVTIGHDTVFLPSNLENVNTGEEPDPGDAFACQTCKKTLFRDGMAGLLLIKLG